jgi:hypothetical protein
MVALIEILSPGNKASAAELADFVRKVRDAIRVGIHVTVIDLLPPGPNDPEGIHGAIVAAVSGENYELPEGTPLTFVAYSASETPVAYLQHPVVGEELPDLPVFLAPEFYVDLPLQASYATAWSGVPAFWRAVIEGEHEPPEVD